MGTGHDVTGMWWQGAEEPPATLIFANEQDIVHPDPPHGYPPSHQSVLGEPAMRSASSRNMEPSARLCLHSSLPNLPKLLGLPANQGWRMEKGKYRCSEMPENVTTSLRSLLIMPWVLALIKGA